MVGYAKQTFATVDGLAALLLYSEGAVPIAVGDGDDPDTFFIEWADGGVGESGLFLIGINTGAPEDAVGTVTVPPTTPGSAGMRLTRVVTVRALGSVPLNTELITPL